jgi:hypothetical protein
MPTLRVIQKSKSKFVCHVDDSDFYFIKQSLNNVLGCTSVNPTQTRFKNLCKNLIVKDYIVKNIDFNIN